MLLFLYLLGLVLAAVLLSLGLLIPAGFCCCGCATMALRSELRWLREKRRKLPRVMPARAPQAVPQRAGTTI